MKKKESDVQYKQIH